jgi:NADH-quinone oxidoreductase subunit J
MTATHLLIVATAAFGGMGAYLMMPRVNPRGRAAGAGLAAGALAGLWFFWRPVPGAIGLTFCFYLLGSMTAVAALMTITQRSPVASALWFAATVIGTAGLMLLVNAQFLAAATVIVYAGAIIVMFLFVIMLAQQSGRAPYDRLAREPAMSVIAAFALLGALTYATLETYGGLRTTGIEPQPGNEPVTLTARLAGKNHVGRLGAVLFTEHLVSVEVGGTLLLVSLVGAIVIAARRDTAPSAVSRVGAETPQRAGP